MNVAIMQPYFLPYLGYWQLLVASDVFVLYDNIQFTKKGWFHRNNILLNGEKKLFTLPLKQGSDYLNVVERYLADDAGQAISKILAQIKQSYRKAPYFDAAYPVIEQCFLCPQTNLFYFTEHSIRLLCQFLGIERTIIRSSDIAIDHSLRSEAKVIALCQALGAKRYINAIGGLELYNKNTFQHAGLELCFLQSHVPGYRQFDADFVPYLSVIDLIMFTSQQQLKEMLADYSLVRN
ncbi:WbqC family protein [Rheinheimera soli]|jgi:hypothetical protein|uniref:WbqC-like protein family protein n=1 Tax=Rheinheimera soli TaxID=443616 RepID=A0ABU1VU85_9GAMM|nr:WbqC family protein [Rheinheimera soli]MDR7119170.1 hypothetical protein [Rheinheimera soli]